MKTTPRWLKSVLEESNKAQPAMPWARTKRHAVAPASSGQAKSGLRIATA